jgi:hypothetical protein
MYVIHENYQGRSSVSGIPTKLKDDYLYNLEEATGKEVFMSFSR